ncbi:cubilin-like [Acanthaster planci]|uniref:Cubilin-like n=1 Tax=Acanthaster planci TaxID=133434 RepID=A0A8B7ZEA7_ACAPL|nr:cubilin-like [Acanthaster planci]
MKLSQLLLVILIICSVAEGARVRNHDQTRRQRRRRPPKRRPAVLMTTEPTTAARTTIEMQPPPNAELKHKPQFSINGPVPEAPSPVDRGAGSTNRRSLEPGGSRTRGLPEVGTRRTGSNRLSTEQQLILLEAHNDFRGQVRPTAANMVALQWDDDLAAMAQVWADQCRFMHGGTSGSGRYGWVGQNLWAGSGTGWDLYGIVESWFNEEQYYTYSNGQCSGVCGHYTQVVWAESKFVGCAFRTCPTIQGLNGWSPASILVCNYGEGGNYIGMKPYISGIPCSQCPAGYTSCIDGELCALPEQELASSDTDDAFEEPETSLEIPSLPDLGRATDGPEAGGNAGGSSGSSSQPNTCGGTSDANSGEISSPNWPAPYGSNIHCEWVIQGKRDQTVTLQVTYMDIEAERRCLWDYLQVKPDGPMGPSTKYCGNVSPSPITSQANEMRVVFHSDDSVNKGGFSASYRLNGGEQDLATACGGKIGGKKGSVKSPNYPRDYDGNLDCLWTIEVPEDKRVRLTFKVLVIEEHASCDYDRVTIRIGNERVPMIFCGNETPNGNIISLSNRMEIRLVTDKTNNRRGFWATWRAI